MSASLAYADTAAEGKLVFSSQEYFALARQDFWCFVELVFGVLHPAQKLVHAQYLDVMATLLMRVEAGKYRRVVMNLPPRHMKSMMVSVLYVAWRLGRDPSAKFICISYGDDLAHDLSSSTRKLMLSPRYRAIFPRTCLDKRAVDHIKTTKGGGRYATSVGSDITGFGADVIIIDDPMQPDDATSEAAKARVRTWVAESVMTRFNDPSRGALICVMHRLAPDDLSATLAEDESCFVLKLPLIAERTEHLRRKAAGSYRTLMRRSPGDVLSPRLEKAEAEQLKATLPPHVWSSQYQQRPTIGGSGMLSIDRFRRYDPAKAPTFEFIIHSWDIGGTISGNASVCTRWGVRRGKAGRDVAYLLEVLRLKQQLPGVTAAIRAQDGRDKPALIILDERGIGMAVVQTLNNAGLRHCVGASDSRESLELEGGKGLRPNMSKIERFGRAIPAIDDGRVLIPNQAPWLDAFLNEVAAFPNASDKDQVDSMSQFLGNLERANFRARLELDRRLSA